MSNLLIIFFKPKALSDLKQQGNEMTLTLHRSTLNDHLLCMPGADIKLINMHRDVDVGRTCLEEKNIYIFWTR